MNADSEALIYLYGIVPNDAAEPDDDLRGLEDSPVHLLRSGRVAAIVSAVPGSVYADEPLNTRLDDLAWVGERGLAHERVLDWFADRGPVIPLSLFSLHHDISRVEARVRAEEGDFASLLERLEGRKEWGIKLWRREDQAREGVDRLSPSLEALGREIEESPPGKRFLLERKRETMRTEELRTVSKRTAHEVMAALRAVSDAAVSVPLPADVKSDRVLLLHAAFLVQDSTFESFQKAVTDQATRLAGSGFEIEFTGPWPPYHFADPDDE